MTEKACCARSGGHAGRDGSASQAPEAYGKLLSLLAEVYDIRRAIAVLDWDQKTYLPPGGTEARGEQVGTLASIAHSKGTSREVGDLLVSLAEYERSLSYDSDEASMIRVTRREYEQFVKIPADLVAEMSRAGAIGYGKWVEARIANDFGVFRPALEHLLGISRQIAQALGYGERPMDAFVDLAEPGMTAAKCQALFDDLREVLLPLVKAIVAKSPGNEDAILGQYFSAGGQMQCGVGAVRAIGFDDRQRGRVDFTVHPFTTSFSPDDVRITTRVDENSFAQCFFSLLHEAGHGIYEQGIPARFRRTQLGGGASAGMHESQSRLWENIVGRSREFWQFLLPRAQAFFPAQLGQASVDGLYRAVNRVRPSFIRTEADEVTYNLHIMMRFELEKDMLEGRLTVSDLKDAWNHKMETYLGIRVPSDLQGVLQDVHWSGGVGGGFQGYTLGNVIGVQLFEAARKAHPGLRDEFRRGEFSALFNWMRENVHARGAKFTPEELVERACGGPLSAKPYLDYISTKYSEVYGL